MSIQESDIESELPPPVLTATEGGCGRVLYPDEWLNMDPLLRADILKDWLYDFQCEYSTALAECRKMWGAR